MTNGWLSLAVLVYVAGLVILRQKRQGLLGYVWGAFGLAGLIVLFGEFGGWNVPLGAVQVDALAWLGGPGRAGPDHAWSGDPGRAGPEWLVRAFRGH